jgi:hypothetical protein
VGDKPGKYWDYRECAWVKCPESPADARGEDIAVPPQERPVESAEAEADEPTVVGTAQ